MRYNVIVKPGSAKEEVAVSGGEILVRTRKRAHDGEANVAVIEMIAKHFKIGKTQVEIIRGAKSKQKVIEIK